MKIVGEEGGFGDPDVLPVHEPITMIEKVGAKEPFGAVAGHGVADFLSGNKSDTLAGSLFAKKEDEIGGMPRFGGLLVDRIELTGVTDALKIFYTANRFRPLARRALMILRPFLVFMRVRNPWVRLRGVLWG